MRSPLAADNPGRKIRSVLAWNHPRSVQPDGIRNSASWRGRRSSGAALRLTSQKRRSPGRSDDRGWK